MGSGADFEGVWPSLPGWRHLAPDLPGHGRTRAGRFGEHAMPSTAAALVDWLDQAGIKRPHLIGYSMGGRLALHLACHHRARFASVVAISATPGLDDAEEAAARRNADRALARRLVVERVEDFLAAWNAQPLFAGLDPADPVVAAQHARRLSADRMGFARSLRAMGTGAMAPLWRDLPSLSAPVDAVVGERDAKFVAIARRMAESGPVTVHAVPDSGHAPHLEQPARLARTLINILRRNETRPET
jgi:2-succinyl-6-hydroxy-2,4-cyclohexadiene-1-carboxylate synthase